MNILLFLSVFPFNILLLISNTYQQKDYLIKGETKFYTNFRYNVPFEQKLLDSNQSRFPIELIHEEQIENQNFTNLTDEMKLFYFQQVNEEEDNMIMTMDNQRLYCLYAIKNYLLDQQLVIHPHFCNITLPYQSCNKLIQVKKQVFITICKLNDSSIITIFNLEGKVFDQISLEFEQNCNIDLTYGYSIIFIFEQNCQSNNVYQVEIDKQLFQYKSVKKFDQLKEMNITTLKIKQIQKIEICNLERIYFIFQNFLLQYNLKQNNLFLYTDFINVTVLKIFQLCSTSYLQLDIEHNSKQMRMKQNLLNISSSSQYKNAFIIEKILVLYFNGYILAKITDQLQHQINITVSEILPLIGSAYFIGVYQSKLKLFQIQTPRNYNQFITSQKILNLIFFSDTYHSQYYIEQSEIKIIEENETKLIPKQQKIMLYLNDDNQDICFEQKLLSETLPINVIAIKTKETYYQINKRIYMDNCNFNFPKYIKIVYFGQLNDQIKMLVIFKQEDIIAFVFCQNGQITSEKNIKLITQVLNIFVIKQRTILICYEKIISLVRVDDSLQIHTTNFPQEHKIINIYKRYIYISILYEGCKILLGHVEQDKLVMIEESQSQSLNCTFAYKIQKSQIIINQDEIIFVSSVNMRYKLQGKIVKVLIDIVSDNFVIVVEEENEIKLKFYCVLRTEIVLQYIIPMYNFKYHPTATQQYENQFLMVSAKYQNKSYLLIYNLRNPAINALIYITEIDESLYFYQFYENPKNTVVYFYEGNLYFYHINQFCCGYSFKQSNDLITRKDIQIVVNSLINNQSAIINIQISKFNNDYTLNVLNNTQQLNFLNKPINLDLIRGNIIRVDLQKKEDFVLTLPLNITSEHLACDYFESNVCFHKGTFIDIKTLNVLSTNSIELRDIKIKGIIFDEGSHTYKIIFTDFSLPNLYISELEQTKDNLNQSKFILKTNKYSIFTQSLVEYVKKVKIIQNIYFFQFQVAKTQLYYKDICQIIINSSQSTDFMQYYADCAYLSNNRYLYFFLDDQRINLKIIAINNEKINKQQYCYADIIQQHEINLLNIFNQLDFQQFHMHIQQVEIISVAQKEFTYVFQFLMLQHTNFSLLLEISLNDIKYDQLTIESYRFLRYEKNAQMLKMIYADKNFVVATFEQEGKQFVNVYDIKGEMKSKDYLDSIYRLQSFDYERIEKFNASHYVIYSKMNKTLYFMTLNQYKVECLGQCTESANLVLSNDVSNITLELSLENQSVQNYLTIKSGIILSNLSLILIFLKFGKRANRISFKIK